MITKSTLLAIVNLGTAADLLINLPASTAYTVLLDTNAERYGGASPTQLIQRNGAVLQLRMRTAGVVVMQSTTDAAS
jgi:hypothetical protein